MDPNGLDGVSTARRAESSTVRGSGERTHGILALHVLGPRHTKFQLLPWSGVLTIGRAPACAVVVDDARVSRNHAAIQLAGTISLSDLGSANGTFVGSRRLSPGDCLPLALGESFSVGDSTLCIRPSGLVAVGEERILSRDAFLERLSATGRGVALFRVEAQAAPHDAAILLGPVLATGDAFLTRWTRDTLAIAIASEHPEAIGHLQRTMLQSAARWGRSVGDPTALFLPSAAAASATVLESARRFLDGSPSVHLQGGPITLCDPVMVELQRTITRIARAPISVLIQGETGAGKDVVASMIHELSPRAGRPLIRLNCASLPEALLESELFGYERGAFTGATTSKPGLLETADGGTVFLDEIGELPLSLQAKLLLAVERLEITRLGGREPRKIDVRFVAATNRNLRAQVEDGHMRGDLYYRLNGITVMVPPLRERVSEIEPLALRFVEEACRRFGIAPVSLSRAAISSLTAHPWPGNVRELRHTIERAVLLAPSTTLGPDDLRLEPPAEAADQPDAPSSAPPPASRRDPTFERARIESALASCGGNQSRAAELLHMPRRTLVRKIVQLRIVRPRDASS